MVSRKWPSAVQVAAALCTLTAMAHAQRSSTRLVMDILSNPVFTILPFALWAALIAAAVYSFNAGGEGHDAPLRSARDILEEHLTRHDIDREEYVDRRKALDHITAMV